MHGRHLVGSDSVAGVQSGDTAGLMSMSWHLPVAGSQIVQHAKQSQPGGASLPQVATHLGDSVPLPIGGGQSSGLYLLAPSGQSATVLAPSRQHT